MDDVWFNRHPLEDARSNGKPPFFQLKIYKYEAMKFLPCHVWIAGGLGVFCFACEALVSSNSLLKLGLKLWYPHSED